MPVRVEVPLDLEPGAVPGQTLSALVVARSGAGEQASTARRAAEVVVAEPGWTMFLVSHFHYDPVWWNTQAAYTQVWDLQADDGLTRPVWEPNAATMALYEKARAVAKDIGIDITHGSAGGGSDANFTGAMGIATLDGLGMRGNGAHTLNEHIEVDSLPERGRLMAGLLATLD